jgi:Fe-S cluster assembly protein SufD
MNAVTSTAAPLARLRDGLAGLPGGDAWHAWRARQLDRLAALGLPAVRDEAWKYANLRLVERRVAAPAPVRPLGADAIVHALASALPDLPGVRYVFVDGRFAAAMTSGALPEGARFRSLADALPAHPPASFDAVLPEPGDAVDERVRLLNAALLTDGAHLAVDRGVAVEPHVHLIFVRTGGAAYSRVVVDVGANASLTLVEHHVTVGDAETFGAPAVEMRLADGAAVDHYRVQLEGPRAVATDDVLVTVGRDARYVHHTHAFGGQYARTDLRIRLDAPGATTCVNGLFFADGSRHIDLRVLVDHAAPHTTSTQVFRGVGAGRGRGAYDGKVLIRHGCHKASSDQSSRNLLLSPTAEIDSRPQLEIYTDDVKAGHGATTGALDEDMLFYQLSRGLDRETAKGLLTFAFAEDVVAQVRIPALRRFLENRVLQGLPDADRIREFV